MELNTDYAARVSVYAPDLPWVESPTAGVHRRLLERDGAELARATSIVRYAPGARFPRHEHGLGEELIVLSGTFADEHGSYAAGTYVRNPPGSAHAPFTDEGCELFVKLRYLEPADQERRVASWRDDAWQAGTVPGLSVQPLASFRSEHTAFVRWAPGTRFNAHTHWGGEEIFVIEGELSDELGRYPAGTWIRNPHGSRHTPLSVEGCLIWVKVGHLMRA